jgi:hypothetical protein
MVREGFQISLNIARAAFGNSCRLKDISVHKLKVQDTSMFAKLLKHWGE